MQGKQSWPIQKITPPQRGNLVLSARATMTSAWAWRAWLQVYEFFQAGRLRALFLDEQRPFDPPGGAPPERVVDCVPGSIRQIRRCSARMISAELAPGAPTSEWKRASIWLPVLDPLGQVRVSFPRTVHVPVQALAEVLAAGGEARPGG